MELNAHEFDRKKIQINWGPNLDFKTQQSNELNVDLFSLFKLLFDSFDIVIFNLVSFLNNTQ